MACPTRGHFDRRLKNKIQSFKAHRWVAVEVVGEKSKTNIVFNDTRASNVGQDLKDVDPFGGCGPRRDLRWSRSRCSQSAQTPTCHCLSLSHGNSSALEAALADCILDSAISTVSERIWLLWLGGTFDGEHKAQ